MADGAQNLGYVMPILTAARPAPDGYNLGLASREPHSARLATHLHEVGEYGCPPWQNTLEKSKAEERPDACPRVITTNV